MGVCFHTGMFCCLVCRAFVSPTFAAVLRHMCTTHATDQQLALVCPIQGCPRQNPYTNFWSFRSHVYTKHRDVLKGRVSRPNLRELPGSNSHSDTTEHPGHRSDAGTEDVLGSALLDCNPEGSRQLSSEDDFQFAAAHFLLKTKEERKITQSAVDGIVQDMTGLWNTAVKQVQL